MNRFYAGQRVRVVNAATPEGKKWIGAVGTIVGPSTYPRHEWRVVLDGDSDPTPWHALGRNLEPLDDDSRSLTTWDEVAKHIGWKPGQRVGA